MEYIHNKGYKTLHLDQLLDCKTLVPEKSLVITFDDGWADNFTNAFPILKEYGLTATIFVITGFIGKANYMDWNQLREMSEAGISIQSHTVNHKPLAQLSKAEVEYELETSKKTIADHLGTEVSYSSMPHGSFDKRVLETAQQAGYECICTSEPGYGHMREGIPVLRRINISDHYHLQTFEKIIEKNRMTILPLIVSKKLKNLLKRAIGAGNYRKLYHLRYTVRD